MGSLVDGTGVVSIDLPLIRYVVHAYGVECEAWPPRLDILLRDEKVIQGWEVWCESLDAKPRSKG